MNLQCIMNLFREPTMCHCFFQVEYKNTQMRLRKADDKLI